MHPRPSTILFLLILLSGCSASGPRTPLTATGTPQVSDFTAAGRWIEVVLADQIAYLWQDGQLQSVLPVSSGVGDSPATTTYTVEYEVTTMYPGPEETAPGVYVRDVVIFDWEHGNGFHSLPMDEGGRILDPTIGTPASAGCIRVRDSTILYEFASVGMKVVIR